MCTPKKVHYNGFDVHFIQIQIYYSKANHTIET
jgi:hypothetical protein